MMLMMKVMMRLRVLTEKKRRDYKQKENEAVDFPYDLTADKPELLAKFIFIITIIVVIVDIIVI